MFNSGWMRLWLVATAVLLGGVAMAAAYYVWGVDACYKFVTVAVAADKASQADRELAESVKNSATTEIFCGTTEWSTILTLEGLARRGIVTQVGFQWLEPSGWTFADRDMLDILSAGQITTKEIISRVTGYVHHARLLRIMWWFAISLFVSAAALLLGIGIAWTRRGFAKE